MAERPDVWVGFAEPCHHTSADDRRMTLQPWMERSSGVPVGIVHCCLHAAVFLTKKNVHAGARRKMSGVMSLSFPHLLFCFNRTNAFEKEVRQGIHVDSMVRRIVQACLIIALGRKPEVSNAKNLG